jgi:hypothetical protein
MTWLQYLAYLVVGVTLRAVAARFTPNPDQWLLAGFFVAWLGFIAWDRGRWRTRLDQAGRASPADLAAFEASIPLEERAALQLEGALGASDVFRELETPEIFSYPPGSATLLGFLFWLCCLFSAGMFLPLIAGPIDDPANDWVLFTLGLLFLFAGLGYRSMARTIGRTIRIDSTGVTEVTRSGAQTHVAWRSLAAAAPVRFSGGFRFRDISGTSITVEATLRGYTRFLLKAAAYLRASAGAS